MILSAYRNPPYRSPTAKNKPPQQQPQQPKVPNQQQHLDSADHRPQAISPNKRKRSNSTETIPSTPAPLRLDTISRVQDEEIEIPASPRTKIADTFSKLHLSPKKKLKCRESGHGTPQRQNGPALEIGETPQPASQAKISSPSPSPKGDTEMDLDTATDTPLPEDPDQSALTWQPTEITGHLISPSDPDDDGEGINGIGFKPTASMAYARSQKRKQQVSEWKVREAREARQRRLEKRRGGSGGDEGGRAGQRVRFLDDGDGDGSRC